MESRKKKFEHFTQLFSAIAGIFVILYTYGNREVSGYMKLTRPAVLYAEFRFAAKQKK